jgi:hypothetical protein
MEKDKELVFVMTNGGRDFRMSNKNAVHVNYDLIDRVIHSVPLDTSRHQSLYHNLIYKQVPLNLRPNSYSRYIPQFTGFNFNDSRFVWKFLNRTIYRDESESHLRNPISGDLEASVLNSEFGLVSMTNEDRFYKKFMISRKDFIHKLKETEDAAAVINQTIYEKGKAIGRKGVLSLSKSIELIRTKVDEKERQNVFAEKFGAASGMTKKEFR